MKRVVLSAGKAEDSRNSTDVFKKKLDRYALMYAKDPYDVLNKLLFYAKKYGLDEQEVLDYMDTPEFYKLIRIFYDSFYAPDADLDQDAAEDIDRFKEQMRNRL